MLTINNIWERMNWEVDVKMNWINWIKLYPFNWFKFTNCKISISLKLYLYTQLIKYYYNQIKTILMKK